MKIVCLDAATLGGDADLSEIASLGEFESYEMTEPAQTAQRLAGADVVITNKVLITDEIMAQTALKLICVSATGTNNIDMQAAQTRGIAVKNVAGYSTNSVVQQTFASLFALTNALGYYADYGSSGKWCESEIFTHIDAPISEIYGKEFGVIGLGQIGAKVARIATAFGANVRYCSTSGANDSGEFARVGLDTLLRACDIVSIHAPLNEKTAGLIGETELAKMKEGAILMNFGRGGIVDEEALARAVDERGLRTALDVLQTEPMRADHPLLRVKNRRNVIITPHIAWASIEARKRLIKMIAQNIRDFMSGK